MAILSYDELNTLAANALQKAGASAQSATTTARHLAMADAQGLSGHGVSRVPQYAVHLRLGRAQGHAIPRVVQQNGGALLVDAENGLSFAACELAVGEGIKAARKHGVALAAVTNSHHFGVAALHLLPAAESGLVALAFSNSPAAMPAWGGKTPLFGTNPIAAMFPRPGKQPLVIDLSLSEVARGKVMIAAKAGKDIPLGWALDREGKATTDAKAALEGSMLPAGGVKGAMLALIVELLVCTLTGAAFGFEADSFFIDEGNSPRLGQAFVLIDPSALAGKAVYNERIETIIAAMLADGVRLPGARRDDSFNEAQARGIAIPDALHAQLVALSSS